MDRMKSTLNPLFTDITWGAGGSTASLSLEIAQYAHNSGHVANLHMTCTNMVSNPPSLVDLSPQEKIRQAVMTALQSGITNLVALRGDPPAGQETWIAVEGGFTCALDLVTFLRTDPEILSLSSSSSRNSQHTALGISVAGYPEGHPNAISKIEDPSTLTPTEAARSSNFEGVTYACLDEDYEKELVYLKRKVDAGAGMYQHVCW
jgi:methylenetetrahydrofolate reductase (NADPH)